METLARQEDAPDDHHGPEAPFPTTGSQSPHSTDDKVAASPITVEAEEHSDSEGTKDSDVASDAASVASCDSDYPALELNYDALKHIATFYLPGGHGRCVDVATLQEGTYYEIRALRFEDGWSCIGRFTRDKNESMSVAESDSATLKFIKQHTTIPVPEVYFANYNPNHAVGAAFVLTERMPGKRLSDIWPGLISEHKLAAVLQIADVLAQLARLHFRCIGSLREDGSVGPLQNLTIATKEPLRGPYDSFEEYMLGFLSEDTGRPAVVMDVYSEIKEKLRTLPDEQLGSQVLKPPYRLIHGDLDLQNMLVAHDDPAKPPQLTGIIDWDNSFTGPAYYVFEYPIFIQDNEAEPDSYDENKMLRKHFVKAIANSFPAGSEAREEVWGCFRQKCFWLNAFRNIFTMHLWHPVEIEHAVVQRYLDRLKESAQPAYDGRLDYEPDSELEQEADD